MTLPETYKSQVQHIQESPKFQRDSADDSYAVPFPGYTIITPPYVEETENAAFYDRLQTCQQQLLQQLNPGLLVPVPPESFHVTLADLIWDSAYRHATEKPGFEEQLRDRLTESFQKYQSVVIGKNPARWQVLGLMLMTRAVGVCLIPREESSYERILRFRRAIYQNPGLMGLGVEQQYHFTAHITLGYFGEIPPELDRSHVSDKLVELNHQWLETDASQEFLVHRAELRKFDDMTRYYREADWPVVEF